jgi:hypothetical protein
MMLEPDAIAKHGEGVRLVYRLIELLETKAGRDWHHHSRALRRRSMGQGG